MGQNCAQVDEKGTGTPLALNKSGANPKTVVSGDGKGGGGGVS